MISSVADLKNVFWLAMLLLKRDISFSVLKGNNFCTQEMLISLKMCSLLRQTIETCQDLDHTNFFDKVVYEDLDIPYDDTNTNDKPSNDGNKHANSPSVSKNSFLDGSPTIDPFEDELGHPHGSNGSALENEVSATLENENAHSEGTFQDSPITDSQTNLQNQPVRRSERSSIFPNKYNEFVVDSKVRYGLEKFVSYANLNSENFYFTTKLNKLSEPKFFLEASKTQHWK